MYLDLCHRTHSSAANDKPSWENRSSPKASPGMAERGSRDVRLSAALQSIWNLGLVSPFRVGAFPRLRAPQASRQEVHRTADMDMTASINRSITRIISAPFGASTHSACTFRTSEVDTLGHNLQFLPLLGSSTYPTYACFAVLRSFYYLPSI